VQQGNVSIFFKAYNIEYMLGNMIERGSVKLKNRLYLHNRDHWSPRICPILERKFVFFSLEFDGGAKAERCHPNSQPSKLIRDTNEILEPRPELPSTDETRTKAEAASQTSREDSDPRDAVPIQLPENLRRMRVYRQRVEQPRPGE
jgi:hypothetical protein